MDSPGFLKFLADESDAADGTSKNPMPEVAHKVDALPDPPSLEKNNAGSDKGVAIASQAESSCNMGSAYGLQQRAGTQAARQRSSDM